VRSEICDLVLRSVSNQTGLVACLDEAAGRLWVRRDKLGALKGLISWACGLVLGAADVVHPPSNGVVPVLIPRADRGSK
jgi:hypothetical protein